MSDKKKAGNLKSITKGNIKKPSVIKNNKPKSSPAFIIGFFIIFILLSCLLIFFLIRKNKSSDSQNSTKPDKTIHLTATKEPDRIIIENNSFSENNSKPKGNIPYKKKPAEKDNSHSNKYQYYSDKKETTKVSNFPNKFVSPAKEWQPINPGLRVATNNFKNLVYGGSPVTIQNLNILENLSYYSAYCERRKNPIWVAYRLDAHKGQNKLQRPPKFVTDFRTKSKVNQNIYAKTGYDRGHMCPNSAIAARYGKQGQMETFLMSNICPQKPDLNRKVWERLERLEEAYANKFGGIWVITGPIFDQHVELLNHQIEIPDAFFKILIDEDKGKVRVLPFIIPQNVTGKEILNEYLTSVDEIEKQTNLDFFNSMDDEYESKLESYVPGKTMWN